MVTYEDLPTDAPVVCNHDSLFTNVNRLIIAQYRISQLMVKYRYCTENSQNSIWGFGRSECNTDIITVFSDEASNCRLNPEIVKLNEIVFRFRKTDAQPILFCL